MKIPYKKRVIIMKNKLLALLALPILALAACNKANERKEYIGIISAMDIEINLLLKEAKIDEQKEVGGVKYYVGTLKDKPVAISRAGVGKVRASSGVTSLLNSYNISKVIFTGVAGGLRDEEDVLDEVIATCVIEHDYGFITNDGFEWGGGDPGKKEPGEYHYCDESLVKLAYDSAVTIMQDHHVFKGLIATGDQFISSTNYVNWLVSDFNGYACEMEGASIAKICELYDTPYVILRTLSDKADEEAQGSYLNFADLAADQSCKIVLKMLESL